ncbi:MAG: Cys-Xaa-Xaa-Xaa repeat radical SAM target protein [Negativicutes bacterium]
MKRDETIPTPTDPTDTPEKMDRREFLSASGKLILPTLGLIGLSICFPATTVAASCAYSCQGGCVNSCARNCNSNCVGTCKATCGNGCGSACSFGCTGTCKGYAGAKCSPF